MKNMEFLIKRFNEIHGDKYIYQSLSYKNQKEKITIHCQEHGDFIQRIDAHLGGQECPKCSLIKNAKGRNSSTEKFINSAKNIYGDKYDYSLVNYIKAKIRIKIICPVHGVFQLTPDKHLSGQECPTCTMDKFKKSVSKKNEQFINEAINLNGEKYDYSLVDYTNSSTKIKIICPIHGVFEQTPSNHLYQNQDCPKCSIKNIKSENKIKSFVTSLNLITINNNKTLIKPYELDIFIPSHNIAIEYDGLYWHSELHKDKNYHLNKTESCEKQGIKLIHIFEDEWLHKQDIVKSRLKNILGLTETKIFARKCVIKEVPSKDSKLFLDNNHIQGNVNAKIKLGLYYDNELVSIMTFGGLRKTMGNNTKEGVYELMRFCNKLDTTIIGSASRLLSYFIKTYKPIQIVSYADRRWSDGGLYETLGFEFKHNSEPNYFYILRQKREYRFNFRKSELIKQGFDSTKSEHQIMLERGIYRIYDCGNKRYEMNLL